MALHSLSEPAAPDLATREQEITLLLEVAKLMGRSGDPDAAIYRILGMMSQLLGLNRGRVLLPDPDTGKLRIRHAYGLTDAERERGRYSLGEGVTGRVMKTGQIALIQDIDNEPEYLARAIDRATLPQETVAYIAVPIVQDEHAIGVLGVHRLRRRSRQFQDDLNVLRVIASMIGQVLRINQLIAERTAELVSENRYLKSALDTQGGQYGILGESPALKHVLKQVHRIADTQATVLITGDSGTGKEKVARMIHRISQRNARPFISLNCAAIPADLLESELFGHEKGAFTGASSAKTGKIALADGGTLFLDEIGDMPEALQSKILRVLQERVVQPIGGNRDIPVDVRIVAATHKNLQAAVNAGEFRLDLFYRLNVIPLHIPALRDRASDIRLLTRHFLDRFTHLHGWNVVLDERVLERLEAFDWPGNIRQLENVLERAVLLSSDGRITTALIDEILHEESRISPHEPTRTPAEAAAPPAVNPAPLAPNDDAQRTSVVRPYQRVHASEAERLLRAIEESSGNKTRAALGLGLTPRQLRYRLKKLGIEVT
ncbi:transcriptional regulator, NifA subfamily, Fis Family [Thioalkalivibrio sp. K90mix]|uniref:sigma-54 interaction domain-containing protein n=1 Tax=Thioalkalivibrio sp. (strain K90mix) TaxID=396595 RepID=UPI000195A932|nr:sigma-54-dependent Fis family transcriptional regulator [Thioalkalivibrio sp. K90mix]ADC71480.1 transcriptional regulator, NifA subfamily, Fis Family [Thioalkalivibrio sp. K90mix]